MRTLFLLLLAVAANAQEVFHSGNAGLPSGLGFTHFWSFQNSSGTTATDIVGATDATLSGATAPVWTVGGGLDFDDISQSASAANPGITGNMVITLAIKGVQNIAGGAGQVIIGAYSPVAAYQGFGIGLNQTGSNTPTFWSNATGTWVSACGGVSVVTGNWARITLSLSGTTLSCYINGSLAGTATTAAPSAYGGTINFGSVSGGGPPYYAGQIGYVGIAKGVTWTASQAALFDSYAVRYTSKQVVYPTASQVPFPSTITQQTCQGPCGPPPMGWMNFYVASPIGGTGNISAAQFENQCSLLSSTGLLAAGWTYCKLDEPGTTARSNIGPAFGPLAHNFPHSSTGENGIAVIADYVHGLGEKFGYYTTPDKFTCGGMLASWGHEWQDAAAYAAMGVDYLMLDGCLVSADFAGPLATYGATIVYGSIYQWWSQAIAATGRQILFNANPGSAGTPGLGVLASGSVARKAGANTYRVDSDNGVQTSVPWSNWSKVYVDAVGAEVNNGGGQWNDWDVVGIGIGTTDTEAFSQLAIYSTLGGPLILSVDLSTLTTPEKTMLTNSALIKVNQDSGLFSGYQVSTASCGDGTCQWWIRPLAQKPDGSACTTKCWALDAVNTSSTAQTFSTTWSSIATTLAARSPSVTFGTSYSSCNAITAASATNSCSTYTSGYTATADPSHGSVLITLVQ